MKNFAKKLFAATTWRPRRGGQQDHKASRLWGLALCLGLGASATTWAAQVNWRFFTYVSPTDFHAKMNKAFAEDITKASGGRLEITHYAAGELPYRSADVIRAVATNQVQMGQVGVGLAAGDAPELDVFSVPFLCTSYAGFAAATQAIGDIPDRILHDKFGVRVVMNWPIPGQHIWSARKIDTIAAIQGKKIRTWNPLQVDMLQILGGNAVALDPAEVIPALQRGVVDGAITSALSANDWKAYDIVKNGFMLNFTLAHQLTLVNAQALAALPADLRQLVEDKSREWAPRYFQASEDTNATALKNMIANGVAIHTASAQDIARAKTLLQPLWEKWASANGPVARDLLARVRQTCQ